MARVDLVFKIVAFSVFVFIAIIAIMVWRAEIIVHADETKCSARGGRFIETRAEDYCIRKDAFIPFN